MNKKILLTIIAVLVSVPTYAARDKALEEHVNNELTFYKNIRNCTPIESSEENSNSARKIFGEENGTCHFLYRNNIDCHIPSDVAQKFSEVGIRVYTDYSDYGMITSTTSDIKYIDNDVLYNSRYCRVLRNR